MALSGSLKTNTADDGRGLQFTWTATQNVANNTSKISWTLKPFGGADAWYSTGPITITVDGQTIYNFTDRINMRLSWSASGSFTLDHANDGSKSFKVVVKAAIYLFAVNCTGTATFTLDKIARTPAAPTSCTISAGYGNYVGLGDTVTIKWSGASGVITGYDIQYSRGNSGWKDYKSVSSSATSGSATDSFTSTDINVNGAGKAVKYRVRAKNGSYASAWKESNTLTMMGGMDLKVSNTWRTGSVWIKVDGSWKRAKRVYTKVNGTWQYSK